MENTEETKTDPVVPTEEAAKEEAKAEEVETSEADNQKSYLEQAKDEREKMEKVTENLKKENAKLEKLQGDAILGGVAQAGGYGKKTETADEKWAREAKDRYAGTGLDPTPNNTETTFS